MTVCHSNIPLADELTLNVAEIFRTIMGETAFSGRPAVFVRLAGCDLRCTWCDTLEATSSAHGRTRTLREIANAVEALGTHIVCISGGEPLLQANTPALAALLAAAGYTVLVDTNGSKDIEPLKAPIIRLMDIKCPSSGMSRNFNWYNLQNLRADDIVKFVISGRDDYEYAREVIEKHGLNARCQVLLSPLTGPQSGDLTPAILAEWMLWDDLDARMQPDIRKIIFPRGEPREPQE